MKRNGERILQTVLVFLMMAGTVLAFYERLERQSGSFSFWLCLGVTAWLLVFYGNRPGRKKGIGWLAFLLGILAAAWYFGAGWQAVAARIFALYEEYYKIKIPVALPSVLPDVVQVEGALWTLGALTGVGAAYGLTERKKQMLFLLQLPLLLLLLLLLGGVMPSVLPMALWSLSACGGLFYLRLLRGGSRPETTEGFRFFGLFLGVMAALFLLSSAVKGPVYEGVKENCLRIEQKIGDFQNYRWDQILKRLRGEDAGGGGRKTNMGVSGGKIGQVEELIPGDATDLVLTWQGVSYVGLDPGPEAFLTGEIYIRAFASDSYKENNWEDVSRFSGTLRDTWEEAFLMNPLPVILEGNRESGTVVRDEMTVRVEEADEDYLYVPGLAAPLETADYGNRAYAVWAEGEEKRELSWEVYRLPQAQSAEAFLKPEVRDRLSVGYREIKTLSLAESLVRESCLEVPEELKAPLDSMLMEAAIERGWGTLGIYGNTAGREEELLDLVREILWQRAVYTYRPGAVPEGEDLILWFLTENGKGYCTHFASAGVMLFRLLGIPARYCEGYKVTGNGRQQIEVKNRNAHAWVEIYLTGLGWIPVEVTPGYVGQAPGESAEAETEPETEAAPETKPETEAAPSSPEEVGFGAKGLTGPGLFLALVFVGTIGVLRLRKRKRAGKRFSRKKPGNPRQEIEWYAANTARLEREYGGQIGAGAEHEEKAAALSAEEREEFRRLYEEAVFSRHRMGKEAVSLAAGWYEKTLRFYGARLTGRSGYFFRLRYRKQLRGGSGNG